MSELTKISDILSETVFDRCKCTGSIKKAVAFGFWKDICGVKFSGFSMPYDIKNGTLFVSVKNPQVMQELMFCKESLLSKIGDYFLPLNIKINEIRYDYKSWNRVTKKSLIEGDDSGFYYSENEIEEASLTNFEKEELKNVTNAISNLDFLKDDLKSKYTKNVINSIKAKKLRSN